MLGCKLIIGICDDEQLILKQLKQIIEVCIQRLGVNAELITFLTGKKLLERVPELDVVFLDINMPELDGIEIGKYIQIYKSSIKIIMATSKVECFKESFKINAFRFITKPFELEEIEEAIQAIMNLQIGMETIELYEQRKQYAILHKEIIYIISYDSYAEFIVANRTFRKEISLNELEKIMDKRLFFRTHRKYMVNMQWIQKYKNGILQLNETNIPISRRNKKEFEQAYIQFDLRIGRGKR